MVIGSLFSGIGGLEKGLEDAGLGSVAWQVEQDPYCLAVLAAQWPNATRYTDVRTVGASVLAPVDLLCGGFPCTDVSSAGKRAGLGTADNPTERSGLWYEFDRIIGELRPAWVVVENVASGAARWLPRVRRALGARGYESVPLGISAAEVGARHRRERIFVVARRADPDVDLVGLAGLLGGLDDAAGKRDVARHGSAASESPADPDLLLSGQGQAGERGERAGRAVAGRGAGSVRAASGPDQPFADLDGQREQQPQGPIGEVRRWSKDSAPADPGGPRLPDRERLAGIMGPPPGPPLFGGGGEGIAPGFGLPPLPALVRGVHGFPAGLDNTAWRAAGWTPAKVRAARIKALGNSVVPACAEEVGRWILDRIGEEA